MATSVIQNIVKKVVHDLNEISSIFEKHGHHASFAQQRSTNHGSIYTPVNEAAEILNGMCASLTVLFCNESMDDTGDAISASFVDGNNLIAE